ncbi:dual specificity protein phosphatase 13A family protein isoform X2 [Rhinichthys klamathensis goyatoka]|uniref:dual specificity protein phosphatase 13A family protein isoform X2 n=1 Tax=Rhinichthys klamathensis goyatoka TaxID=3034132 RepID=UPI0024B5E460|nr:dual specificity protein phosphatase 13A family protein isoform X2 [Rhinichthys klamathensis goyatoka]
MLLFLKMENVDRTVGNILSETPSIEELEDILHGGKLSCNHVDEVWPNLFLGDMYMSHDRYGLWRLGITHVLNAAHAHYINDALSTTDAKVFVHCAVGVSRSAALVLAYLMIYCNYSLVDAILKVKERRWIFPNRGFLKQLITLGNELNHKAQSK